MSPTQRSLKALRERGYTAAVTEHWNAYSKVRQDLFGFIDILAISGDITLAVQTTSSTNVAARVAKILANPKAKAWCDTLNRQLVVHGWSKKGPRGKRKLWECREVTVLWTDFP